VLATVALVQASFQEAGISIAIDASEDMRLFGFPNEYSQALLNLLNNAKQAIQECGRHPGRVVIHIAREDHLCRLTVRDNGPGIAPHLLERIFEPYFSTRAAGTGIGLYMSRQIIEGNMSGRITARNLEDGAEFSVLIALAGDTP
jgi:signal transduction histidine kinase